MNIKTAQKTVYGKNKEGKYIDLKDAKIYYEEYGKRAAFDPFAWK